MPLTDEDREEIRQIVREEMASAFERILQALEAHAPQIEAAARRDYARIVAASRPQRSFWPWPFN